MAGLEKLGIFALKDKFKCNFYRNDTGELALVFNYGNDMSFESSSDPVFAAAAGNAKAVSFDGETSASLSIKSQTTSVDVLSLQTGSKMENNVAKDIERTLNGIATKADDTVKLPTGHTPVDNKVVCFVVGADNNTIIRKLDSATFASGTVTLTGITKDENYLISYKTSTNVNKVDIGSSKQDDVTYKLVVYTTAKTLAEGKMKPIILEFPKVGIQNSFVLGLSASQVTDFELKMDVLADTTELQKICSIIELPVEQ